MAELKIAVASHKEYRMPDDPAYVPVLAGAAGEDVRQALGNTPEAACWLRDDAGDNISELNREFCELTVLYWIWKNPESFPADLTGLCHYRRLFGTRRIPGIPRTLRVPGILRFPRDRETTDNDYMLRDRHMPGNSHFPRIRRITDGMHGLRGYRTWDRIAGAEELVKLAGTCDIILPACRNYIIETGYSQFVHSHGPEGLDMAREVIRELYPEYLPAFDRRMRMRTGHRFNMFIMRRELMDEYCSWLFGILFEVRSRLQERDGQVRDRLMGHIAERLIDVWIDTRGLRSRDVPYVFTEKEHLILKAARMTCRKFGIAGKKSY